MKNAIGKNKDDKNESFQSLIDGIFATSTLADFVVLWLVIARWLWRLLFKKKDSNDNPNSFKKAVSTIIWIFKFIIFLTIPAIIVGSLGYFCYWFFYCYMHSS